MAKHIATKTRAPLRTFIQALIPTALLLGVVVPQVIEALLGEAGHLLPEGWRAALLGLSAGVAAMAAALSKIMALPSVNALLARFGLANDDISTEDSE